MQIPSEKTCKHLMHRMGMLDHIVAHSIRVCQVALCIADHLNHQSTPPNRPLVTAAALLHDITKTRSFETGENHAETGAAFLEELNYPEVADIVRQHVRLDAYAVKGTITEAEIVNYADKRVVHDKVVDLEDRKRYLFRKYGRTIEDQARLTRLWKNTEALETSLFGHLPFTPANLHGYLEIEVSQK